MFIIISEGFSTLNVWGSGLKLTFVFVSAERCRDGHERQFPGGQADQLS